MKQRLNSTDLIYIGNKNKYFGVNYFDSTFDSCAYVPSPSPSSPSSSNSLSMKFGFPGFILGLCGIIISVISLVIIVYKL